LQQLVNGVLFKNTLINALVYALFPLFSLYTCSVPFFDLLHLSASQADTCSIVNRGTVCVFQGVLALKRKFMGVKGANQGGKSFIISDGIPCFKWSYTDQFVHSLNYPSNWSYQFVTIDISTMAPKEEKYPTSAWNLYYSETSIEQTPSGPSQVST